MKTVILAASITLGALLTGTAAEAMPALQSGAVDNGITQVAGGCGPGGHRNGYGRCVPNFRGGFRRGCPPGMHPIGYGRCRPNF